MTNIMKDIGHDLRYLRVERNIVVRICFVVLLVSQYPFAACGDVRSHVTVLELLCGHGVNIFGSMAHKRLKYTSACSIALRTQRCSTLPSLPKSSLSAARTDWAARRPSAPTP